MRHFIAALVLGACAALRPPVLSLARSRAGVVRASAAGAPDASCGIVELEYCARCKWALRATWLASELLSTFDDGSVTAVLLKPSYAEPGGGFTVRIDGLEVFDRKVVGRHVESPELKRLVRDCLSPDRSLGHSEGRGGPDGRSET